MRRRTSRRSILAGLGALGTGATGGCLGDWRPGEDETDGDAPDTVTPVVDDEYDLAVEHDRESWERYDPHWTPPTESPLETPLEYEVLVENLEVPWDLSFGADGELFVSERPGEILRYAADEVQSVAGPADVIDRADSVAQGEHERDWWAAGGEGGLLGIATHPTYPDPPLLYAFYTYATDDGYANRLAYYDASAADPAATEAVLLEGVPGGTVHNGCRLAFGPANYLWVTTGDANVNDWEADAGRVVSQNLASLAGKVLRVRPDGTPAPDNPDLGDDADPRIYTYGHRNPQGIAFLPDGTPVVTEHGPANRDEVMVLEAGANNGWDRARDGETYPGTEYARPVVNTGPDAGWAPSGCVFYTGDAVPSLRNRLVIGTLAGQHLAVVTLYPTRGNDAPAAEGGRRFDAEWMHDRYGAVVHRLLEDELGRIRHVEQGPDGELYAITCNRDGRSEGPWPTGRDDRLVRITPAE